MTRSIKECNLSIIFCHLVSTDFLGDSTSLSRSNIGLTNRVQNRCFSVIDVSHDRDNWRSCSFFRWIVRTKQSIQISVHKISNTRIGRNRFFKSNAESFGDEKTGVKIYLRIDIHDDPIFHELSDNFRKRNSHFIRKLLHCEIFSHFYFLTRSIDKCLLDISDIFFSFFPDKTLLAVKKIIILHWLSEKWQLMFRTTSSWLEVLLWCIWFAEIFLILT